MKAQKGASLIIVLVVLTVMLLGVVSIARVGETSALVAGNVAAKDAALEASEVGLSDAYADLQAITNPDQASAWYYASKLSDDENGLPTAADWSKAKSKSVGVHTVKYVAERMCNTSPVTDKLNQCVVKKAAGYSSSKANTEALTLPSGTQYRITVSVTGPKGSTSFVQGIVVL